jgi:hypothetical protein
MVLLDASQRTVGVVAPGHREMVEPNKRDFRCFNSDAAPAKGHDKVLQRSLSRDLTHLRSDSFWIALNERWQTVRNQSAPIFNHYQQ